jgi:hypothetical protein
MYSDPGAPEVVPGEEARSRFYEAYKRESNRFDKELKEYNKELNITLLFVRFITPNKPKVANLKSKSFASVRVVRCSRFDFLEIGPEHPPSPRMGQPAR